MGTMGDGKRQKDNLKRLAIMHREAEKMSVAIQVIVGVSAETGNIVVLYGSDWMTEAEVKELIKETCQNLGFIVI